MTIERYWDDAKVGDECVSPDLHGHRGAHQYLCRPHRRPHAGAHRRGIREDHAIRHARRARPVRPVDRRRPEDAERLPLPARHVAGLDLGLRRRRSRSATRVHVRFRVGSMRPSKSKPGWGIVVLPSELDQPARRSRPEGRASPDDPAPPASQCLRQRHAKPSPAACRHPRHRLQPLPGRPAHVALPQRDGRRRHQGRAPDRRRRGPREPLHRRRPERLLPAAEHGQAKACA